MSRKAGVPKGSPQGHNERRKVLSNQCRKPAPFREREDVTWLAMGHRRMPTAHHGEAAAMKDRLRNALEALRNLDRSLSPVALGEAREKAIVEGLHGLAEEYGRKIGFTYIDSLGELEFNIEPSKPGLHDGTYGEELAVWLSQINTRSGYLPSKRNILPQNNWCRIHHFEAEKLLHMVAERMLDNEAEETVSMKS